MLLWEKHTTEVTICIVSIDSTSFFRYFIGANDDDIMIGGGVDGIYGQNKVNMFSWHPWKLGIDGNVKGSLALYSLWSAFLQPCFL